MNANTCFRIRNYFRVEHAIILVPVCTFAIFDSAFNAFSSVLVLISEEYPELSRTTIQMILSVPSLLAIPAMLASGFLAAFVHKRTVGLVAMGIMFAGAMAPWAFRSTGIWIVFASSVTIGIAQGLLHPLASSVVCETWGEGKRKKVLGFKQAANYLGAALCTVLVGVLATTGWRNSYLVYLLLIPAFAISFFKMPEGKLDRSLVIDRSISGSIREIFNRGTIYLLLLVIFAAIFQFSFFSNIAMTVAEKNFGTSIETSQITAVIYIVSFVLGISFGKVSGALKDSTLAVGFGLEAVGLLTAALAPSFAVTLLGGALFGAGSCMQEVSTVFYLSRESGAKEHITMVISLGLVGINLGIALSPLAISLLKSHVFHSAAAASGMMVGAIGFIALAVIELAYRARKRKQGARGEFPGRLRNH
jgi:MFS family permease